MRERLLISWIGPRGIVAAAIASATAVALERAGIPGGEELLALVFLTIASTVLLVASTTLSDILNALIDPRIREAQE